MKIAIIADIHGNPIALDAVLRDAAKLEPDIYLCLGDIVDGYDPTGCIRRVAALPNLHCILGNTDRYIMGQEEPPELTKAKVAASPEKLPTFQQATGSFAWSRGHLCATGWYSKLFGCGLEWRTTLADGRKVLAVHASPGLSDGPGIAPYTTDDQLAQMLAGCPESVLCVGHTHLPFVREFNGKLIINPGSVSNPLVDDLSACYALVTSTDRSLDVDLRQVPYDNALVIDKIRQSHHPAASFMIDHQLGKKTIEGQKISAAARWYLIEERNRTL